MSDIKEDDIRKRAYDLWEAAGRPEGSHESHWHQAREELVGTSATPPKGRIKVASSLKKPVEKKAEKADEPAKAAKKSSKKDDAVAPAAIKGRAKKASTATVPGTS